MDAAERATEALGRVVARLDRGEARPGQVEMCRAVAESLELGRHLVVEAGTGVGKSLAYLVPAVLSGQRVVVATATKALQDQLITKDVPFLQKSLGAPFEAAVLKGRSNYLCLARLGEAAGDEAASLLSSQRSEVRDLGEWVADGASSGSTGERDELPVDVGEALWRSLTVAPTECPGAKHCPRGEECFAERAIALGLAARVVVVNLPR